MPFPFLTRRRRAKLLGTPLEAELRTLIESEIASPHGLSPEEASKLVDLARVFAAEKYWEGCAGLELTDRMRHALAAQACLLILSVDGAVVEAPVFPNVRTVLVYPGAYADPTARSHEQAHLPGVRAGEAHFNGPVVLSWADAKRGWLSPRDGRNVVLHEFAHALDMLNGAVDGTPPLPGTTAGVTWREVMTNEYGRLIADAADGTPTVLDTYGATNPAEFFAVATESFFERPTLLAGRHPDLYAILRAYYRQDPATRRRAGELPLR
jgi:MtfA peptidase